MEGERENQFYHWWDYEGKMDRGLVGDHLEIGDLSHGVQDWNDI